MAEQPDRESRTGSLDPSASDADVGPSGVPEGVLDLDPVYDALAHPRRRYLCYALSSNSEWSLAELATRLIAWEADVLESEVSTDQRDRVVLSLYHVHVPKLVEQDIVSFDPNDETVEPAESTARVLSALKGVGASLDSAQESHARSDQDG